MSASAILGGIQAGKFDSILGASSRQASQLLQPLFEEITYRLYVDPQGESTDTETVFTCLLLLQGYFRSRQIHLKAVRIGLSRLNDDDLVELFMGLLAEKLFGSEIRELLLAARDNPEGISQAVSTMTTNKPTALPLE